MAELNEKDLQQVDGGSVVLHNMPKINPDEKYVMSKAPDKVPGKYDDEMYVM